LGELTSYAGRVFRRLRPRVLWVSCIAGLLLNGETSVKSGAGRVGMSRDVHGQKRTSGRWQPRIVFRASR